MFKYTTALQWLLDSAKNKLIIGDDTCVFWANAENPVQYEEAAFEILAGANESGDSKKEGQSEVAGDVEVSIKAILEQGAKGIPSAHPTAHFNPDANFYVLGLAPNAGRLSVRYFYRNSFAKFCDKIKRYHDDTEMAGNLPHIKIGNLIYGTVSAKSKDKKVNPLLGGAIMRAVLSGGMYPQLLLNQVVLRIKAERQVTQARAAAIKAYLIRNKKEDVSPMLNEQSTNPAYVLGRTFAILEKIQYFANNAVTIRDSYFSAACSNPVTAFPKLLKLAQHHLSKIGKEKPGLKVNLDKELGKCLDVIEHNFPKAQSMEQQGMFILGYYQQKNKKQEGNENGSNQE
jgi:CRISPR-associated protein Csd1